MKIISCKSENRRRKHLIYLVLFASYIILLTSCMKWTHDPFSLPPNSPDRIDNEVTDSIRINIAHFNVSSGIKAIPIIVAKILIPYNYDVICFTEVPEGDWIERVGKILGMDYYFRGSVSSANEKDKFKAILSKTPIHEANEFVLNGKGWHPASALKVEIYKNENKLRVITLQIPNSDGYKESYAWIVAKNIADRFSSERLIITGDFDNTPYEPALRIFGKADMYNIWDKLKIDISKEYTCCLYEQQSDKNSKRGITDHILFSKLKGSHLVKGGFIDVKYDNNYISNHKPIWAFIDFPPPALKKRTN